LNQRLLHHFTLPARATKRNSISFNSYIVESIVNYSDMKIFVAAKNAIKTIGYEI